MKERILELRVRGHTYRQIAAILNEQGWMPLKGRRFTDRSVGQLLRCTDEAKLLSPRRYLEHLIERMKQTHEAEHPGKPFQRPGYPRLAGLLTEAGYATPRGRGRWWPAQVQQLLAGRYERYYRRTPEQACRPE